MGFRLRRVGIIPIDYCLASDDSSVSTIVRIGFTVGVSMVHVLAVGAGVRKALPALIALKRLRPRVEPEVLREVMLVLEGLLTRITLVRALS
jgi:hypothetical protein